MSASFLHPPPRVVEHSASGSKNQTRCFCRSQQRPEGRMHWRMDGSSNSLHHKFLTSFASIRQLAVTACVHPFIQSSKWGMWCIPWKFHSYLYTLKYSMAFNFGYFPDSIWTSYNWMIRQQIIRLPSYLIQPFYLDISFAGPLS